MVMKVRKMFWEVGYARPRKQDVVAAVATELEMEPVDVEAALESPEHEAHQKVTAAFKVANTEGHPRLIRKMAETEVGDDGKPRKKQIEAKSVTGTLVAVAYGKDEAPAKGSVRKVEKTQVFLLETPESGDPVLHCIASHVSGSKSNQGHRIAAELALAAGVNVLKPGDTLTVANEPRNAAAAQNPKEYEGHVFIPAELRFRKFSKKLDRLVSMTEFWRPGEPRKGEPVIKALPGAEQIVEFIGVPGTKAGIYNEADDEARMELVKNLRAYVRENLAKAGIPLHEGQITKAHQLVQTQVEEQLAAKEGQEPGE
jgi:hypothetical protein